MSGRYPAPQGASLWPIELLHPEGAARRRTLLGSNCPPAFGPAHPDGSTGALDLVVVAPTRNECRNRAFLDQAAATLERLDPDGLGYVIAPPRWRARLWRRLHRTDLVAGPTIGHFPARNPDQHLVPVESAPLLYALTDLMGLPRSRWRRLRRRLVQAALVFPGTARLIGRLSSETGVIVRRNGGTPLLRWNPWEKREPAAVISTRWRVDGGTAVIHVFRPDERVPSWVAKVALSGTVAERTAREAAALECLGPAASRAGARVPDWKLLELRAGHSILVQRILPGRRAASLLREGTIGAMEFMAELTDWLESWNRATVVPGVLERDWLERELLEPGTRVASQLVSGADYLDRLRESGNAALGRPMPRVATHNDLTTHNVLLDAGSLPAVLDWEAAGPDGVPLADFFYAAVDGVAAAEGGDAEAAFLRCFQTEGPIGEQVRLAGERLRRALGLEAALVPLCFHACWIHHAANELRQEPQGTSRPFLRIVGRLASQPVAAPWTES